MIRKQNYDSPWKTIVEKHFAECVEFYYPEFYVKIDWEQPFRFLDQELSQIQPKSKSSGRRVDKLAEVKLLDGSIEWVLIHIEIQGQKDDEFAFRMFVYYYRLLDKYNRHPVSLAILTDPHPNWRPQQYHHAHNECEVIFNFPTVKLLDYGTDVSLLAESKNPFALVTLAHLRGMGSKKYGLAQKYDTKKELFRLLVESGYAKQQIIDLHNFIDWIITLPEGLDERLAEEMIEWNEGVLMEYMSYIERRAAVKARLEGELVGEQRGEQHGEQKGRVKILLQLLSYKFKNLPDSFVERLWAIEDVQKLDELAMLVLTANRLEDISL